MANDFSSKLALAEQQRGLPDGLLHSLFMQETGGRSDYIAQPDKYHYEKDETGKRVAKHTGKVSTAFGPFGLLESTANNPGYGVKPLADKSLDEQIRFAADYVGARIKSAGGVEAGLAGYGEGKKYASQVMDRLGKAVAQAQDEGLRTVRPDVLAAFDQTMPGGLPEKAPKPAPNPGIQVPMIDPAMAGKGPSGLAAGRMAEEGAATQAENQKRQDVPFMAVLGAAGVHSTDWGSFLQWRARETAGKEYKAVPGFRVPDEALFGVTEEEAELLNEAHSPDHLAYLKGQVEERRTGLQIMNNYGVGWGMAASMLAGAPTAILTGRMFARAASAAKLSSTQLALQGKPVAATVSAAVEGAVGNVAVTAAQDVVDPFAGSVTDYGMGLFLGAGTAMLGKPWAKGLADDMHAKANAAADRAVEVQRQAEANLGPGADDAARAMEVRRLEANQIQQQVSEMRGAPSSDRRLLPDPEPEVKLEAGPVKEATLEPAKPVQEPKIQQEPQEPLLVVPQDRSVNMKPLDDSATVMTHKEALARLTEHRSLEVKTVASRLLEVLDRSDLPVKVKVVPDAVMQEHGPGGVRAFYYGADHTVVLPESRVKPGGEGTVLHELAHAATVLRMKAASTDATVGGLVRQLEGIRQQALSELANRSDLKLDGTAEYYLKNINEFVAGLYSTRAKAGQFLDLMKSIKVEGEQSLFTQFVETIRKILGIPDNEVNAFTKALGLSDKLMDTNVNIKLANTGEQFSMGKAVQYEPLNDPIAIKSRLNLLPTDTAAQQAEAKNILHLYKRAEEAGGYKPDPARLSDLMNTAVFKGAQAVSNVLARSENPIARMFSAELLESPGGTLGRRSTASIQRWMKEREYLGNTMNEVQASYSIFRRDRGGSWMEDTFGGKVWSQFNKEIAEEIEARRVGSPLQSHESVRKAADSLEKAYERMRVSQIEAKTSGHQALPETSVGYMPHRMSASKFASLTADEQNALHAAMTDQFITRLGFDMTFSDKLATSYLDMVRSRAFGGNRAPVGIGTPGAADMVEDALRNMGMDEQQIEAAMKKVNSSRAGHTKHRMDLDLTAQATRADGSTFRLLDVFETDQFALLRSQASRVSGDVALTNYGIYGRNGLNILRKAMEYGEKPATADELNAFDQAASELLGDPVGGNNKLVDRVLTMNALARLGGMGFTQFAEGINGVFHVGVANTLDVYGGLPRLRKEIVKLAKGEKVNNPLLQSAEELGGVQFGTESYKTVFPFDHPDAERAFSPETVTVLDRLLRGGGHLQGKLSLWRSIHAAQHRGFAESIVRKAAQVIRDGGDDVMLADMGIHKELADKLRADWPNICTFDGSGKLTDFDLTKATDGAAAAEFVQAMHRGINQIIQGTFAGERGRWASDPFMRVLTQFRTFSLTSVEKQWARQVGNVGPWKAAGMVIGSLSMAAPIYIARVAVNSIGREDAEEYINKRLTVANIAANSLNYIAMAGLAKDFLDVTSAVTGHTAIISGGRSGAESKFVGNLVAPAAGLADDLWAGVQDTKEGTDPSKLIKSLPFSNIPAVGAIIRSLGDD